MTAPRSAIRARSSTPVRTTNLQAALVANTFHNPSCAPCSLDRRLDTLGRSSLSSTFALLCDAPRVRPLAAVVRQERLAPPRGSCLSQAHRGTARRLLSVPRPSPDTTTRLDVLLTSWSGKDHGALRHIASPWQTLKLCRGTEPAPVQLYRTLFGGQMPIQRGHHVVPCHGRCDPGSPRSHWRHRPLSRHTFALA